MKYKKYHTFGTVLKSKRKIIGGGVGLWCLTPLSTIFQISLRRSVLDTTLCDKVYQ
jgi:hypothetical protein